MKLSSHELAVRAAYRKTPQGKAAQTKYNQTLSGKFTMWKRAIKWKFRMTPERYDELLALQGGGCGVCGGDPGDEHFHIDHDHSCCPGKKSCGKCIRGLLCGECNRMLGLAHDDPQILQQGARYVTKTFLAGVGSGLL